MNGEVYTSNPRTRKLGKTVKLYVPGQPVLQIKFKIHSQGEKGIKKFTYLVVCIIGAQ